MSKADDSQSGIWKVINRVISLLGIAGDRHDFTAKRVRALEERMAVFDGGDGPEEARSRAFDELGAERARAGKPLSIKLGDGGR